MFQTEYLSGKQSLWIVNNGISQSPLRKGSTEIETFFFLSDQEKALPIFVIIKNKLQAPSLSSVLIKSSPFVVSQYPIWCISTWPFYVLVY